MTATDAKRKAATAARTLLADRITAVEKLGIALHNYTQAQTQADELAELARTAFDEARATGWTAAELRRAGLTPPRANSAKNNTPAQEPTHPVTDTNALAPEATS
jgi:hypothetical protein